MPSLSLDRIRDLVGTETGVSDWILVDQARITAFAEVTEDRQFIHVDPAAAALTPFGGTVAHGFLTLSLLSRMAEQASIHLEGAVMSINYGLEKVRFLAPVRAGRRVRGRFTLLGVEDRGPGQYLFRQQVTVDIEDEAKPALIAEWLGLLFTQGEMK